MDYHAPDKDLWSELKRGLGDVPMTRTAHQTVLSIFEQVEREAMIRAQRAKATAPPEAPSTE